MARDQNQELKDTALVVQQDEFNAPVGQEQVLLEGQVQMEEQKLEQPRVEGQGDAGQGAGAQVQQQVGDVVHQQPDERRREQVGAPGSQSNERGHAGRSHLYRGHSGYGRGLGRGGYGRAQARIQQSQPGQYDGGRAGSHLGQPNNLGPSLEDVLQQSNNYNGNPAPRPS